MLEIYNRENNERWLTVKIKKGILRKAFLRIWESGLTIQKLTEARPYFYKLILNGPISHHKILNILIYLQPSD